MTWTEEPGDGLRSYRREDGVVVSERSLFEFVVISDDGTMLKTKSGRIKTFADGDDAMRYADKNISSGRAVPVPGQLREGAVVRLSSFPVLLRRIESGSYVFRMPGGVEKKVSEENLERFLRS